MILLLLTMIVGTYGAEYKRRFSGYCGDSGGWSYITSTAACEAGAAALGLSDKTATVSSTGNKPYGCYYAGSMLYFNQKFHDMYKSCSIASCICTMTCAAGTYYNSGSSNCQPCPSGTYQVIVGQQLTCSPLPQNKFVVEEGDCTTSGSCFQSPNYPNFYGSSQSCTIKVQKAGVLSSVGFNTESGYDILTIGGTAYHGTSGPYNVAVSVNDVFTWSSDGNTQKSGFKVCLVSACLETDGGQANAETCICGTATCSSSTGLFCDALNNECGETAFITPCSEGANSVSCACGTSDCTASTGLFCTEATNTCRQISPCLKTGGSAANPGDCDCGAAPCTASTGLYCTEATNTCHDYKPNAAYYYDGNTRNMALMDDMGASALKTAYNNIENC
jgi:hypothetical protein